LVVEFDYSAELGRLMSAMLEAELNINYLYSFIPCPAGKPVMGLSLEDNEVAETVLRFHEAGARHIVLDFVGPYEERDRQIERFAAEAMPLLAGLRGGR